MKNDLVREGYDKIALNYSANRDSFHSQKYVKQFSQMLKKGSSILDVGCGAGKPIDDYLIRQGFSVQGIDISSKQIELAKKNVPQAFYEEKDMLELQKYEYCVNGIVSFYAIFHTPREQHQKLFHTFASFLPNGGVLLVTMGAIGWEGEEENLEKNKEIIEKAGFSIVLNEIDTSGGEKHQIIIAKI